MNAENPKRHPFALAEFIGFAMTVGQFIIPTLNQVD